MHPTVSRPGKLLAVLASFWLVLPVLAPAWTQSASPPPPAGEPAASPRSVAPAGEAGIISRGSPVQGGPAPDLVIFYAGEVMGWTEPCG